MKNKILGALAALVLTAVALFAAPAAAYAYPSDCSNSAYICFYTSTSPAGGWDQKDVPSVWSKSVCYSVSASSIIGRTGYISNPTSSGFAVYLNSTCSGTVAPIYAHSSGAMNSTWNAKIRSLVRLS